MRAIPAAAERFDEQDGGVHATAQDVDVVALVVECGGLRGDDLQIGVDAADVAVVEDRSDSWADAVASAAAADSCCRMRSATRLSSTCWKAVRMVCW